MKAGRLDVLRQRLHGHRLVGAGFADAEAAVAMQLAVQAQDYAGALWGVAQRVRGADEASIERALAGRRLVRSWPLRGTLHLVAAADLRWLLALAGTRSLQRHKLRLRRDFDLDDGVIASARKVCERALGGGRALTRDALYARFDAAGIATAASRGLHLLWWLAHEGTVCFGPRAGKQHTLVLLDDWLPPAPPRSREDALATLARRYFASRGPASVQDFAWWSGLAAADAAAAHESVRASLAVERIDAVEYWYEPAEPAPRGGARVHLLPAWDEYTVAYRERGAFLDAAHASRAGNGIFKPALLADGRIAGTWKRTLRKTGVEIVADWFVEPAAPLRKAFDAAASRYAAFLGVPRIG